MSKKAKRMKNRRIPISQQHQTFENSKFSLHSNLHLPIVEQIQNELTQFAATKAKEFGILHSPSIPETLKDFFPKVQIPLFMFPSKHDTDMDQQLRKNTTTMFKKWNNHCCLSALKTSLIQFFYSKIWIVYFPIISTLILLFLLYIFR
jgi:hypothetical protein